MERLASDNTPGLCLAFLALEQTGAVFFAGRVFPDVDDFDVVPDVTDFVDGLFRLLPERDSEELQNDINLRVAFSVLFHNFRHRDVVFVVFDDRLIDRIFSDDGDPSLFLVFFGQIPKLHGFPVSPEIVGTVDFPVFVKSGVLPERLPPAFASVVAFRDFEFHGEVLSLT